MVDSREHPEILNILDIPAPPHGKASFINTMSVDYEKYPDVHQKVVMKYVRFRTFVQIKYLNYQLSLQKAKSKKAKDRPGGRRAARKTRHFTT